MEIIQRNPASHGGTRSEEIGFVSGKQQGQNSHLRKAASFFCSPPSLFLFPTRACGSHGSLVF